MANLSNRGQKKYPLGNLIPKEKLNLTGHTYGDWTVLREGEIIKKQSFWHCRCVCGKEKALSLGSLRSGMSKGCGCNKARFNRPNVGDRFGEWTIYAGPISVKVPKGSVIRFPCVCKCGTKKDILLCSLKSGSSQSCGCVKREKAYCNDREFHIWQSMIYRCTKKTSVPYPHYGGRGITVCERWKESYHAFLQDMGKRPTSRHTLDRIDNNGNYEPSNCRWATYKTQLGNRRVSVNITVNGVTCTVTEWAEKICKPRGTVYDWHKKGILEDKIAALYFS